MVVALLSVEMHIPWARSLAHADRELAAAADEIERVEPGIVARTQVEFL